MESDSDVQIVEFTFEDDSVVYAVFFEKESSETMITLDFVEWASSVIEDLWGDEIESDGKLDLESDNVYFVKESQ